MLTKYGSAVSSVFDLLGRNEVDLTAALGWVLSQSPFALGALADFLGIDLSPNEIDIDLEVADELGRTDIELTGPNTKVIIEAKQGWLLPNEAQLLRYAPRFDGFDQTMFVTVSDSSETWTRYQLPNNLEGVPVRHIAWDDVRQILATVGAAARPAERIWLTELEAYMGRATSTRPDDTQWLYCVVVSDEKFAGYSFRDYPTRQRVYFHEFGGKKGWPKKPPKFLGFRWGGQVRQVNRVQSYEIVPTLASRWPDASTEPGDGVHVVYELGPDIPIPQVSTKGTFANARVWCLLDQLLVSATLQEAARASKALAP